MQTAKRIGRPVPTIQEAAWKKLGDYQWPGNVRELQHVVRRAALVCRGTQISPSDLELKSPSTGTPMPISAAEVDVATSIAQAVKAALTSGQANLHDALHEMLDGELLRMAFAECGGNQVQTARRLGLSRNGLRAKMRALGLE